jgi:hypothetical protein
MTEPKTPDMKQYSPIFKAAGDCVKNKYFAKYIKAKLKHYLVNYDPDYQSALRDYAIFEEAYEYGCKIGRIEVLLGYDFSHERIAEELNISAEEVERIIKERIR